MLDNPPCLCGYKPLKYTTLHIYLMYLMSFLNLEVLKGKPTRFLKIMPHLKLSKNMFLEQKKLKKKKELQLIWTYENMVKF